MPLAASAVRAGLTGSILYAPPGTTLPTATSTALAGFVDVGYATDDGVTVTVDTQTADIRGWQNGDLLRRIQQSVTFSVHFIMAETNENSLKLFFNNYTHGAGVVDGTVTWNGGVPSRGPVVIDVLDSTNLMRIVMPDAQVTDRGDISIVSGDIIKYEVTMAGYPDATGNSGYMYVSSAAAS